MNVKKLLLVLGLTIAGAGTALAAVHTIGYARKSAAVGTTITGADGNDYVIVRIPFATFGNNLRYSVFVPAPADGSGVFVNTTHTDAALPSNATIDGLPARIRVGDGRVYLMSGIPGTASQFLVSGSAQATVEIKIGNTLVTIVLSLSTNDTQKNAGTATDVRSLADWAKYKDPTVQITTLNNLIDYIRIIAPAT
jgi:hypothetical protein